MEDTARARPAVSVIIPAYNEMESIARVITAARAHPLVGEVIVVDDGSTDATSAVARAHGAVVIRLAENQGKATAMDIGVQSARFPIICFVDADIIGLTANKLDLIIRPVVSGRYDMYVGIRSRRRYWLNRLLKIFPLIGGERALTRDVWEAVPSRYKEQFEIEIALNYSCKRAGLRMGRRVIRGLSQVIKEKKWGLGYGLIRRYFMIQDLLIIGFRLYVIEELRQFFVLHHVIADKYERK